MSNPRFEEIIAKRHMLQHHLNAINGVVEYCHGVRDLLHTQIDQTFDEWDREYERVYPSVASLKEQIEAADEVIKDLGLQVDGSV